MSKLSRLLLAVTVLTPVLAHAQSSPGLFTGQIPSATDWNGYFSNKVDVTNGVVNGLTNTRNESITGTLSVLGAASFASPLSSPLTAPGITDTGQLTVSSASAYSLTVAGGASGVTATVNGAGNSDYNLTTSGLGRVQLNNAAGGILFSAVDNGQGSPYADRIVVYPATAGNPGTPILSVRGTDANISLLLQAVGTGTVYTVSPFSAYSMSINPGTVTFSGSQGGQVPTVNPFFETEIVGGTTSAINPTLNFAGITSDTLAATGSGGTVQGWQFLDYISAGASGEARNALQVLIQQMGVTNGAGINAIQGYCTASYSFGGTNTGIGSKGYCEAANFNASLNSGATNVFNLIGGEIDVAINGGSAGNKIGWQITGASNDTVQAANESEGLSITDAGKVGFAMAIGLGHNSQAFPLPPNGSGTVLGVFPQDSITVGVSGWYQDRPRLATAGIDLSLVNFSQQSGNSFIGPGFAVDGKGNLSVSNGVISSNATGMAVDIPDEVVTAAAISFSGGGTNSLSSYVPGDIVQASGFRGSQLLVQSTKVISAIVGSGGTGGTTGNQIVTGTTGTGTKFQASVAVAGGTITTVNSITTPGVYTVNPINGFSEPVTGGGLTGATLGINMGINVLSVLVPPVSAAPPANPIALLYGSGLGATANLTWAVRNTLQLNPSGGPITAMGPMTITNIGATGSTAISAIPYLADMGWLSATANGGATAWTTGAVAKGKSLLNLNGNQSGTIPNAGLWGALELTIPSITLDASGNSNGFNGIALSENLAAGRKGKNAGETIQITETGLPSDAGTAGVTNSALNLALTPGAFNTGANWIAQNNQVLLNAASNSAVAETFENSINAPAGSVVNVKLLGSLTLGGTDAVHGTTIDAGLALWGSNGITGNLRDAFLALGKPSGQWIGSATAWLAEAIPQTSNLPTVINQNMAGFLNAYGVVQNVAFEQSQGFWVGPGGETRIHNLDVNANGANETIDVTGRLGAITSVTSPGVACAVGDIFGDGLDGLIQVTAVTGGNINVGGASYVAGRQPHWFGGGQPATITPPTAGHCSTMPTFAVAWTAPTSLQIGASVDILLGTTTALATTATAGFTHPFGFTTAVPTGTPANTNTPPCLINTTSGNLNCYYGGSWHHQPFSAGAG